MHAWVPGGEGPVVPGHPPLGCWGASRGLPGGGPAQTARPTFGHFPLSVLHLRIGIDVDVYIAWGTFWDRFGLRLGGHLGQCWLLSSAQVGPGTVLESYYRVLIV